MWSRIRDRLELAQEAQAEQPLAHIAGAKLAAMTLSAALQFCRQQSVLFVASTQDMDAIGQAVGRLRPGLESGRRVIAVGD